MSDLMPPVVVVMAEARGRGRGRVQRCGAW
jgi:hypothetical protein